MVLGVASSEVSGPEALKLLGGVRSAASAA